MSKYRKKPIEIEAFKYDGDLIDKNGNYYVPKWAIESYKKGIIRYDSFASDTPPTELFIGIYHVEVGDFIIKGVNGEIYPCKPDIFEKTYEELKGNVSLGGISPSFVVERPYQDGWIRSKAIVEIKKNKVILVDGEEIEINKLKVKINENTKMVFYAD